MPAKHFDLNEAIDTVSLHSAQYHLRVWHCQETSEAVDYQCLSAGPACCLRVTLVVPTVFQQNAGGIVDQCEPHRAQQGPAIPSADHNDHITHLHVRQCCMLTNTAHVQVGSVCVTFQFSQQGACDVIMSSHS